MACLYVMMCLPLLAAASSTELPLTTTKIISTSSQNQTSHQTIIPLACTMNKTESHHIVINTSIVLTCCTRGFTILTIWKFNGMLMYRGGDKYLNNYTNVQRSRNDSYSHLHIDNSTTNNAGTYTCSHDDYQLSYFVIDVSAPISELFLELEKKLNSSMLIFLCYGDQQPTDPFTWTIEGNTTTYTSHVENKSWKDGINASTLYLYTNGNVNVICQYGNLSANMSVLKDAHDVQSASLQILVISMGASAFLICFVASSLYLLFTYACPTTKDRESHQSSLYSMPSISSIDRERRVNRISIDESAHREESVSKIQVLQPSESFNSFERDIKDFGIDLQSFRSNDAFNEFWEASLCDGKFKDSKIVVRSLTGKATVDLLEEFRKFQIGLGDLPSHSNVWNVLGCCTDKLPYRICYEFHASTTIREYLLGNFQSSDGLSENGVRQTQTLISLATGIANGMVFLKSYAFDHVALRSEKILIDQTTRCKLYDFCLSSQSQQTAIAYLNESEVLAWLAPELIFLEEYNQWTDIWAFGVVMWELWCGGRTPHCGKSRENLELDLRNQRFLVQPNNCPGAIYSLMLSCWKSLASDRKMFTDIHTELIHLNDSTDTSWYDDFEYSSLPGSTFYTVLDNNYDKCKVSSELGDYPLDFL